VELRGIKESARQGRTTRQPPGSTGFGELTAHESIELLPDQGSFTEIEALRRHRRHRLRPGTPCLYSDGVV
jgi:acetyl-CoA carboxylase carboxyltransferase component